MYGTACVLTTVAVQCGLIDPYLLILNWKLIFYKFQVWRLLTNFIFLGPFGFPFVIRLLMIIRYGVTLEKVTFEYRTADYAFMLIFSMAVILGMSALSVPYMAMPLFSGSLVFLLVYVWSRNFPEQPVSIMGVFKLQGFYLPWALLVLTMLMGGSPVPDLIGILIGHLYYFLTVLHPAAGGRELVKTPQFLKNAIQDMYGGYGFVNPNYRAPQAPERRAFQGRGRRLGD